jgi:hypothetical protein
LKRIAVKLEKHCGSRPSEAIVRQAAPCTKLDLKAMVDITFKTTTSSTDYGDGALLVLMWHLLGRSSDMRMLSKCNLSYQPSGSIAVRFGRVKTSLDQGLALFPDQSDFRTCPIHALAVAAVIDEYPSDLIFRHLPSVVEDISLVSTTHRPSLVDLLQSQYNPQPIAMTKMKGVPGVHAYVNRVLQSIRNYKHTTSTPISADLSSHSFRRGAAQFANSNPKLSLQWILDRGGWQLSAMNRGFMYIVNTTSEDQAVGKSLSGWDVDDQVWLPMLHMLDKPSSSNVRLFQAHVFQSALCNDSPELRYRADVLDILTATLIANYSDNIKIFIRRFE